MKFIFFIFFILFALIGKTQSGEFGLGVSCVYQNWKQSFDAAPNISVGVNKTLFTFSSTLNRGRGPKLSYLGVSDWNVVGEVKRTIGVGYYLKLEDDVNVWLVPVIGGSLVSEILQTNNGWIYGQPKIKPSIRVDIRYSSEKIGLGYFISFGNIENGTVGILWRYKK